MAIPAHSGDDDAWRGEEFRPAGEFWPHTILPLQYFPPLAPQPEKKLMAAVLEDALRILLYKTTVRSPRRRRLFVETDRWFRSNSDAWPFSFVNCCHTLGIDVAWLRERVRAHWARDRIPALLFAQHMDDAPPRALRVDVHKRAG